MERYTEAEERPKAFEEMGRQIQQYMKFVEAYKMKVKPWTENLCPALDDANLMRQRKTCMKQVIMWLVDLQDEQYDHLDEADVTKVDKLTGDAMIWMNSAMGQQSKMSLSVDPSVTVKDIQAKTRVSRDKRAFN